VILCDVNVFVYAFREESPNHPRLLAWLEDALSADRPFAVADLVLSGFLRVVTHPRIFQPPTPPAIALSFTNAVRNAENAVPVAPGPRHWEVFQRLCQESGATGNLVSDAYLAALAIESGCEWITTDRDYARFGGLRWRHPLA
jgi:toxin-antitoxin system PIN domain toxin